MNQLSPLWLIRCPNLTQHAERLVPPSHFAANISTLCEFLHICSNHYRQLSIRSPPPSSPQSPLSSVNLSRILILIIMTKSPMVTIISNANPNQPNIIAVAPTPLRTLPLPRSWAMVLAATEAVCCHSTDTSTNTDAMKIRARATCETGREGKGWSCCWEPLSSTSSCQPGKVARMRKQINARIMATILRHGPLLICPENRRVVSRGR